MKTVRCVLSVVAFSFTVFFAFSSLYYYCWVFQSLSFDHNPPKLFIDQPTDKILQMKQIFGSIETPTRTLNLMNDIEIIGGATHFSPPGGVYKLISILIRSLLLNQKCYKISIEHVTLFESAFDHSNDNDG